MFVNLTGRHQASLLVTLEYTISVEFLVTLFLSLKIDFPSRTQEHKFVDQLIHALAVTINNLLGL